MQKAIENLTDDANRAVDRCICTGKMSKRFTNDRLVRPRRSFEIARLSGNETLAKTLVQVFERIILKRRTDGLYDPARGVTAHQEHLKLLHAMKRRNTQEAIRIVRTHIRAGKDNVLADLKQRQEIREFRQTGTVS